MRIFAWGKEKWHRTIAINFSNGNAKVVFGKFFAALSVILITLVISLMFFAIISYFGKPNIGTTLVAILGFIFLSMAAISVGMFASSLTENQIIAGVITVAFLVISLFTNNISSSLEGITLIDYYTKFAQGIISIENIISLLLFTFVFISLTIIVMQRRKLVK